MNELKINEAFRDLIPPLADHEKSGLEEDIKHFGCYCPIITWNGYIIDGHNRHKICTENNVEFQTLSLDECFDDETDVRIWIIDHQDGRRELEPFVRAELEMEKADLEESKQGKRTDLIEVDNTNESTVTSPHQYGEVDNSKPYKRLAKKAGVSPRTYSMACYIAKNATEEVKKKLRKGETAVKTEYNKLKKEIIKFDVRKFTPTERFVGEFSPREFAGFVVSTVNFCRKKHEKEKAQ